MSFLEFLNESSVNDLYQSTIDAFPYTSKRQHATDPVKINKLIWSPFIGLKTLFLKALAQNESREYLPIILFKNVQFGDGIPVVANDKKIYKLQPLSLEENEILVRCNCKDFTFRFKYYNYLDHSLHGPKGKKYEGLGLWEANPKKLPGMCKHLLKTIKVLESAKILK